MTVLLRALRLLSGSRSAIGVLALALLPACQATPAAPAVSIVAAQPARCDDTGASTGSAPRGQAFLDAAAWQAHLGGGGAALRGSLASWAVDFARGQSVALVRVGPQPNPGYRVRIEEMSLPVQAQTVRVKVILQPPPGDRLQAQVIAFPCIYLKLEGAPYQQVAVEVERRPAD